jgi:hypothetical protein
MVLISLREDAGDAKNNDTPFATGDVSPILI